MSLEFEVEMNEFCSFFLDMVLCENEFSEEEVNWKEWV